MATVHPDVPVDALTETVAAALGDELVGLYVYGSAVSGDFDPGVSDVDLLAVTRRAAIELDIARLESAHGVFLRDHPDWDDRLEIAYVGAGTLRAFRSTEQDLAIVSPGEPLHFSGPVRDWLQNWFMVREAGIALLGAPASEVLPEIARSEFVAAVSSYASWLAGDDLERRAPGALAYAVLSACRAMQTVQTGEPGSKREAAAWLAAREPTFAAVIDSALACRMTRGAIGFDHPAERSAAVAFVRQVAAAIAAGQRAVTARRDRIRRLDEA